MLLSLSTFHIVDRGLDFIFIGIMVGLFFAFHRMLKRQTSIDRSKKSSTYNDVVRHILFSDGLLGEGSKKVENGLPKMKKVSGHTPALSPKKIQSINEDLDRFLAEKAQQNATTELNRLLKTIEHNRRDLDYADDFLEFITDTVIVGGIASVSLDFVDSPSVEIWIIMLTAFFVVVTFMLFSRYYLNMNSLLDAIEIAIEEKKEKFEELMQTNH